MVQIFQITMFFEESFDIATAGLQLHLVIISMYWDEGH